MQNKEYNTVISKDRIAHMHGVAEYMYAHAADYKLDPEEMYILGLLHDIGYIQGFKEGHEQYGAEMLFQKLPLRGLSMKCCIERHSQIPQSFSWNSELCRKQYLLLEADMKIDGKGRYAGYNGRLKDIAERYGSESEVYKKCAKLIDWLINNEEVKHK